jgi:hypothetical protein
MIAYIVEFVMMAAWLGIVWVLAYKGTLKGCEWLGF